MDKLNHRYTAIVLSFVMLLSLIVPLFAFGNTQLTASAISADYPAQLMNIAAKDNSGVLTENGTADNSSLSV